MDCPTCGNDCYDNRQQNQTRVAEGRKPMPDFKCKDKDCGWIKWGPKPAKGQKGQPARNGGKWTWQQLSMLYGNSLKLALKHVEAMVPNATPAETIAAAATIFIAATRDGVQPLKKPEPPKPEPEPEPENEDDLPW